MALAVSIIGIALVAFCVWLTVRFINRREGWAKWTAVGLLVVLVGYPLSLGPACWISSRTNSGTSFVSVVYRPLVRAFSPAMGRIVGWYSSVGAAQGWSWDESAARAGAPFEWRWSHSQN